MDVIKPRIIELHKKRDYILDEIAKVEIELME